MNKKVVRFFGIIAILAVAITGLFGFSSAFAAPSGGSLDPLDPDYDDPWVVDESDIDGCTHKSSSYSWVTCGLVKTVSGAARNIYEFSERFMTTDPELFKNDALVEGWKTVRNLANIAMLVMLTVTILSQISGVGISNYGVKKALPRIIVVVLMINLSYILCRIAIDVMNISGTAIKNAFQPLTDAAWAKVHLDPGSVFGSIAGHLSNVGSVILSVVLAFFGTKTFLSSGESIILLAMFLIISVLFGVLLLFAVITVRAALVVLLTISAPGAIVLSVFPGTKKLFDKWFNLFKGILLCYPMSALFMYGGNFASAVAMAALGLGPITIGSLTLPTNVFTVMTAAAASIAPIIVLPGMIIKSTGAIGAAMQQFARNLSNLSKQALGASALGEQLKRDARDRSNRIIAGVDKDGREKTGALARSMRSRSAEERLMAQEALADSRAKRRSEEWTESNSSDALAVEENMNSEYEDLQRGGKMLSEADDIIEEILDSGANDDVIAGRIQGAINYFNSIDPKNGVDDSLKRMIQQRVNGGGSKTMRLETAKAIAAARLRNDKEGMLKKTPLDYAYYRRLSQASSNADANCFVQHGSTITRDYDESLVETMINDPECGFSGAAMSDYAGPTLKAISSYMERDPSSGPNVADTQRNIRTAYDQMIRTTAYQENAAKDDFERIRKAIGQGRGL